MGALVGGALLLLPAVAGAEALSTEVIAAAERGRELFDSGRYEEAVEFLSDAYETYEEPIFLQYIGRCHQELEHYCDAADYYQRFLDDAAPPEEVREQLRDRLIELDDLCVEQQAADGPPEPEPEDLGPPRRFGLNDDEPSPSHRRTDIAGGVLMGLGGAALVAGAALWVAALAPYYEYRDDKTLQDPAAEWRRFSIPGDILAFSGLAVLATGLIVMLAGRARSRRGERGRLTFGPATASRGLALSLSWL